MNRFTGSIEKFCDIDTNTMIQWIEAIPITEWYKDRSVHCWYNPVMVTDLDWNDFGKQAWPIINTLGFDETNAFQLMLSVVTPGHVIPPHKDSQPDYWLTRIHVPLTGNSKSYTIMDDGKHLLKVGSAYQVNTLATHSVINEGKTPRIHFMFDVKR